MIRLSIPILIIFLTFLIDFSNQFDYNYNILIERGCTVWQ
nr:MAG TPA: hypothetical protein [Bacteriophage sp.]